MSNSGTPAFSDYSNPLLERYASKEMSFIFSPKFKFSTWRKLWVCLAQCEKELGISISDEQIRQMQEHVEDIDFEAAARFELELRHDVMAHIHAFGMVCPAAKPIIHLGATSAFVGDNTDLIQMKQASLLLLRRVAGLIAALRDFALEYKELPTLGFTHFQPAQLTTVGKRACLWISDLVMDFEDIEQFALRMPFRGVKGTTGTQASFLELFEGDHEKVKRLDILVAERMGFDSVLPVTGQTYTRKIDARAAWVLSGIAQSLHKTANDLRLLQHLKEIEEPFEQKQVGSSAMAYKRNPMRSERLTALTRYIITLSQSPVLTAAEQWFERTLDDSANKRLSIPEMFLAADACAGIGLNVCSGLVVYPKMIEKHVREELPFMATENILMAAVKQGGDRQSLHERIRVHSMAAAKNVKAEGGSNDLLTRIGMDPAFSMIAGRLESILNPRDYVGRAPQQTSEYIEQHVDPLLVRAQAAYGSVRAASLIV